MKVEISGVAKGPKQRALPVTSTAYETGTATLACVETEQRPSLLGLIASGRMRPDVGEVLIDGEANARDLRRRVALLDAPEVCDPEPNVLVIGFVEEELMFAGLRADPIAARRWLEKLDLRHLATTQMANVAPATRIRMLCELAVLRRGIEGFVLVSPDRHGGEPEVWWAIAREFAERGYAVLVIAGRASESVLRPLIHPQARLQAGVGSRAEHTETEEAAS
ncbi:hypothetical protein [Leucobacter insecticola]|uniref:hypothetical protein n=1 Tax=Leucobacter insecticola TaxID=2714934 RepID=UPI00197E208B|nr:hypothetical protein [Leucobacter insecticola]